MQIVRCGRRRIGNFHDALCGVVDFYDARPQRSVVASPILNQGGGLPKTHSFSQRETYVSAAGTRLIGLRDIQKAMAVSFSRLSTVTAEHGVPSCIPIKYD